MVLVGIALGSNLGDRGAELDGGVAFVRSLSPGGQVRESPRIETEPVDCPPGSASFLNAVVEIELDPDAMPPRRLMERLQAFESERGRAPRRGVNDPRHLDLDIIYYGDLMVNEPGLIIPHSQAYLRRFVLEPLAALRPALVLPGGTRTVTEQLAVLASNCR